MGKNETYELESYLRDVKEGGWVTISLRKLLRLLDKGSRAAGTWKALLDAWEEIGEPRSTLHIVELPHEVILLTDRKLDSAKVWAGE